MLAGISTWYFMNFQSLQEVPIWVLIPSLVVCKKAKGGGGRRVLENLVCKPYTAQLEWLLYTAM